MWSDRFKSALEYIFVHTGTSLILLEKIRMYFEGLNRIFQLSHGLNIIHYKIQLLTLKANYRRHLLLLFWAPVSFVHLVLRVTLYEFLELALLTIR